MANTEMNHTDLYAPGFYVNLAGGSLLVRAKMDNFSGWFVASSFPVDNLCS